MPAGVAPTFLSELVIPASVVVTHIADPVFARKNVDVHLLRLDLIDPVVSGNKVFKLFPNLIEARATGFDTVLSFGGAYSNHLHALAEAGCRYNFKTIAVVRGDDGQDDSPTLKFAASKGMRLIRVTRQQYRHRHDTRFISELTQLLGRFYLIPEGGANELGVSGCMRLATVIAASTPPLRAMSDEILLACGTGSTMAGLIAGMAERYGTDRPGIRGIAVLKQGEFLRHDITQWLEKLSVSGTAAQGWDIETRYHWGGYARFPPALARFMKEFEHQHGILLDPVYTAKLMSAVYQRVEAGLYKPGTRLLLMHTGGLQGRRQQDA